MASLHQSASGTFRLRFRFGPPPDNGFQRSLDTKDEKAAKRILADAEETIRLLEQGRLYVPEGVEAGEFIVSGGRLKSPVVAPPAREPITLARLFEADDEAMPDGVWEESTTGTETIHRKHLLRLLEPGLDLRREDLGSRLQAYIGKRAKEQWHGGPIQPKTIRKELETLRATWNRSPLLKGTAFPEIKKLVFPKGKDKGRFRTWREIEEAIAVGRLTDQEQRELWECLFLMRLQIEELLALALARARTPWLYAGMVFVADTGARRSEVLRSRREDFLFEQGEVMIRERKRDHTKKETYRYVALTPRLKEVMRLWLARHPGGPYTLSTGGDLRLSWQTATKALRRLVAGTRWENIRGYHVLRHSFASNLAAAGTSQGLIDEWMGHQTETMRRRYRHLFPDEKQKALAALGGG